MWLCVSIYIIAEIGINHNGDINIAKRLISIAHFAGCDCVKFQKRTPDICVPDNQRLKEKETPWGKMTYIDYRKRIEFGKKEYDEIDEFCRNTGIPWTASVWDKPSIDFFENYSVPFLKIPSACLTDMELLRYAKMFSIRNNTAIFLSTGMSTYKEIDKAVSILKGCEYSLLHCNSSYPAKVEELNLACIPEMKKRYQCPIGYSGHEFHTGTTVAAVYLGATIIERHITLNRTLWGSDQFASVEPEGIITLVRAIRDLEKAIGDGHKKISDSEKPLIEKLRRYK